VLSLTSARDSKLPNPRQESASAYVDQSVSSTALVTQFHIAFGSQDHQCERPRASQPRGAFQIGGKSQYALFDSAAGTLRVGGTQWSRRAYGAPLRMLCSPQKRNARQPSLYLSTTSDFAIITSHNPSRQSHLNWHSSGQPKITDLAVYTSPSQIATHNPEVAGSSPTLQIANAVGQRSAVFFMTVDRSQGTHPSG
jgi:hypothetical protein